MSRFNKEKLGYSPVSSSDEDRILISDNGSFTSHIPSQGQNTHIKILYSIIGILLVYIASSTALFALNISKDPSLELWSPANKVVSYKTVKFDSYFFNRSPYLGTPAAEKDALWEDLYDFGISGLNQPESTHLVNTTLPAPNDPTKFIVQLNVFHQLHCVNLLRKAIYKDEYPGWEFREDGRVNHDTVLGLHWDHCLDNLRQSIMCDSDVTPLSFTHEQEGDYNIFPKLTSTHTCRNFDAIREWARKKQVASWVGMGKNLPV